MSVSQDVVLSLVRLKAIVCVAPESMKRGSPQERASVLPCMLASVPLVVF